MFALRIAFLECEVFFFGTASKKGGNSSSKDCSEVGNVQLEGLGAVKKVGRKVAAVNIVFHVGALATPPNIELDVGSARAAMAAGCLRRR